MPNQEHNWNQYIIEKKSVVSNNSPYTGQQGFYFVAKNDFSESIDISDLSDATVLSYFDTDNNGLAEYWPGAPEWHATIFSKELNEYLVHYKVDVGELQFSILKSKEEDIDLKELVRSLSLGQY